jgi:hypothetical protein
MSWHDNHVHALRIIQGEHGAGELQLDLDYILEWLRAADGEFHFRIVPVHMRFMNVTDLKIQLDYATATAALSPFSLDRIELDSSISDTPTWRLVVDWPIGELSFRATGFEQQTYGSEVTVDRQWLEPHERCGV